MVACVDCHQYLADIDGTCPLCRALRRLSLEARSLPVALRSWATDQARVWVSLLQEERLKFLICSQQAAERQAVAASTPKASSPVVFGEATPTTTEAVLPAATKEEPAAEGEGRLASPEKPEESKESQEVQAPSSPTGVAVPEEKTEEKTEKKHKDSKKHKERTSKRKASEDSFSRKREVAKKDKAKKKSKKSRSRRRKTSPSHEKREERSRSSRSPIVRNSAARGHRDRTARPPEPEHPPSGWSNSGYFQRGWHYYGGYRGQQPRREGEDAWGENKGVKKREKQKAWRRGHYYR